MTTTTEREQLEDLLQLFYQCPVGLVQLDEDGRVERVNPAAVGLLAPVASPGELVDLHPLLARAAPDLLGLLTGDRDRLGRLPTTQRVLVQADPAPDGTIPVVELLPVRVQPGRVVLVVVDVTTEQVLARREAELAVQLQRSMLTHGWLAAVAAGTAQVRSAAGEDPLQVIAATVAEVVDADLVAVVLPTEDPNRLVVQVAVGLHADAVRGGLVPAGGTLCSRVLATGEPEALDLATEAAVPLLAGLQGGFGPALAHPLPSTLGTRGVLLAVRAAGRAPFNATAISKVTVLAGHAAVALELADAHAGQLQLALLEDRDRIARDLHDHVIQSLFGTGMQLMGLARSTDDPAIQDRLVTVSRSLDTMIDQIRATIFELRGPVELVTTSLRHHVLDLTAELTPILGFAPRVTFSGAVDTVADHATADNLRASLREALTNVIRHARAANVDVHLAVHPDRTELSVTDDGIGPGSSERRSGLANLTSRAATQGGSLEVTAVPPRGTRVRMTLRPVVEGV